MNPRRQPNPRPGLNPRPNPRATREPRQDDAGQIMPLVLIFALIALSLVIAVVDATAVHIQRNRLYAVADAAALDAADAVDSQQLYAQGGLVLVEGDRPVPLSDRSVRRSVADYLSNATAQERLSEIAVVDPTGSPQPGTAEVTLTARAQLPIVGFVVREWWSGVPLRVTVRAQAREPE